MNDKTLHQQIQNLAWSLSIGLASFLNVQGMQFIVLRRNSQPVWMMSCCSLNQAFATLW
jgi:hypothetical protein